MIEIVWYGRGGQGCFTAARLLGLSAVLYAGKQALAFPAFGPERRGAPVMGFTKIDDNPVIDRSETQGYDYAIVLDETLFSPSMLKKAHQGGSVLLNTRSDSGYTYKNGVKLYTFDAGALAYDITGSAIANVAMLGAFVALSSALPLAAIEKGINHEMKGNKGLNNIRLVNAAYSLYMGTV